MAENVLYADLSLPESTRPRILMAPDVQGSGCTYAEVRVKFQDTNAAANCKSSGKSCCSRKRVSVLVVIILVLILAVYLIIIYGPTAGSQNGSTTSLIPEEALGCPPPWKKHGRKCYFFSPEIRVKDWEASHEECAAMGSHLVIIDSKEELSYLLSQSKYKYYLLGLTYFQKEREWKWINNMKHNPDMFNISRPYSDYDCMVIGYDEVATAPCFGSSTTYNMCEKAATMSKRHQKES